MQVVSAATSMYALLLGKTGAGEGVKFPGGAGTSGFFLASRNSLKTSSRVLVRVKVSEFLPLVSCSSIGCV